MQSAIIEIRWRLGKVEHCLYHVPASTFYSRPACILHAAVSRVNRLLLKLLTQLSPDTCGGIP